MGYNFNYGLVSSVTDPNGLVTSWTYGDGFGRKTQENRPDGTYTTWSYADCAGSCVVGSHGTTVTETRHQSGGATIATGLQFLDPVDRPLASAVPNASVTARNEVRYDSLGRVAKQALPCNYSVAATACSYWITNTYDALNRMTVSQRPISASNSTLQSTTYAYAGRTTTVTDANGKVTSFIDDANGWLRRSTDAVGYVAAFGYDAAGSRIRVIDGTNNLWSGTYGYGVGAFLTGETDMDRGTWTYTVDALGERTAWKDPKAQSFSMTYDALSRPLTRTEPDLYTKWTYGSTAGSHNIGQLIAQCTGTAGACNASGYAESRTYDADGRLSQRAITLPTGTFTYTWAYNSSGLVDTLTYPVSTSSYAFKVQYGYANAVLKSVADVSDSPSVALWTANAMNAGEQVTEETLGNGVVVNHTYDAVTHWLSSITAGVGSGSALENQAFLYDYVGNVTQRQNNNAGLTENAYYDAAYRLTSTKLNNTQSLSISYDAMGNITARSDIASGATWTYNATHKHQVTQAGSSSYAYGYDANGNMTSRQGSTITWTSANYPYTINAGSGSTAETVTLVYGPDRSRWEQSYTGNGSSETTYYIGGLLEKVVGSVTDYRHYIYAGNEPVAVYSRKSSGTNTFSYLLKDRQDSIYRITNSSGGAVLDESYSPFGTRRNPASWSGAAATADLTTAAGITRQGYTFQTQLGLWAGLNHMNGRVEDAITGRFLSADPYGTDDAVPQSFNRYSYVRNNPLTMVDPSGFEDECPSASLNTSPGANDGRCTPMPGFPGMDHQDITAQYCNLSCSLWEMQGGFVTNIGNPFENQGRGFSQLQSTGGGPGGPAGGTAATSGSKASGSDSADQGKDSGAQAVPQTTQQQQPCGGLAGDVLDFTGGQSNQSALNDIVDNFVNTKDSGLNTFLETGSSVAGGSTVAQSWGGVTPLQALGAVWVNSRGTVSIPGLIGFRTLSQLAFTSTATWVTNTLLIKGVYNSGVLVGSGLRTLANRTASALCTSTSTSSGSGN